MNRKAIVVVAPQSTRYGNLPGAETDARNYQAHLNSAYGGAWEDSEIQILRNPSRAELNRALSGWLRTDLVLLAFSGHGYHASGRGLDETRLILNDFEEIPVGEFTAGGIRELCVVDACRHVENVDDRPLLRNAQLREAFERSDFRTRCRALYETRFEATETGRIELYSCALNESAGETRAGGRFTKALIESAAEWAISGLGLGDHVIDTRTSFVTARSRVNPRQHPEYWPGRRLHHFPFAVVSR